MIFAIVTHAAHLSANNTLYSYGPYVREMNVWGKYVSEIFIVAPKMQNGKSEIDLMYEHPAISFQEIENFDAIGVRSKINTLFKIPKIIAQIFGAMRQADHIHLRCPGNMGLLGCFVQVFFPSKKKTAKYAGNWDRKSKQPFSYKLQKWILSNTFLTKNMQVLVYGEWPNQSKNIKPFFTATYHESDKIAVPIRNLQETIRFVFAGTLSPGKRPMYALQLVDQLYKKGIEVCFDVYGEGVEREHLEAYILENKLSEIVTLHGNQNEMTVRQAYQKAHFLVLPSKSEGWPKVVAEAMFWGCVPVSSAVSCVSNMLDNGNRGILLSLEIEKDRASIFDLLQNEQSYFEKSLAAENWSRQYTLDTFETEIKKLLHP